MNARLVQALFAVSASVMLAADARGAPMLPERDPLAPFRGAATAREVLVQYFTASKDNDAAAAARLIDYEEWTKSLGLEGDEAKAWAKEHRAELEAGYRKDEAEGSTKEFRIVKEKHEETRAVFEVTQVRAAGTYLWEVTLVEKHGRWAISGFRLLRISR
jgi:phage terminase Nu1 subunit (DNA packaging protein)